MTSSTKSKAPRPHTRKGRLFSSNPQNTRIELREGSSTQNIVPARGITNDLGLKNLDQVIEIGKEQPRYSERKTSTHADQFKLSDRLFAIASDPKKATDFLKSAGIITKAGVLAPEYA